MTGAYVCADGVVLEYADIDSAIDGALDLASVTAHPRVGVDLDAEGARRAAARALPGMVVCPRCDAFRDVDCCPLTRTTALVRPRAAQLFGQSCTAQPLGQRNRKIEMRSDPVPNDT